MLFHIKIFENGGGKIFKVKQTTNICKIYAFGGYKLGNNVCVVYLECKLQMDGYVSCIFKLKNREKGRNKIFRDKKTTNKIPLMV